MSMMQLSQVMEYRLFVTEKESQWEPETELPSEYKLIPAMGTQEYSRVSYRKSVRECDQQGQESNP